MGKTFKLKRGRKANLPQLAYGEPAYVSDEGELYIGSESGNVKLTHKSEIDKVNKQLNIIDNKGNIYPDSFEGTDSEKIQQAYDLALNSEIPITIIINREYILDKPIYNNKDAYWDYVRFIGHGGQLIQNFEGFMFDSNIDNMSRNAPLFNNITFKRNDNITNATIINGKKYIRSNFDTCTFIAISCINAEGSYLQTFKLHNCEINGTLPYHFIISDMAYDVSIIDSRFEQQTSNYSAINITQTQGDLGISYMSLKIMSSIFEGYTYSTAISLGCGYGLVIQGCYFEANNKNIVLDKGIGNGRVQGSIKNNTFMATKTKTSIEINQIQTITLEVDFNLTNDSLFCNSDIRKGYRDTYNYMYTNGQQFNKQGLVTTESISRNVSVDIKECPISSDGRVLFKFPVNNYKDIFNSVNGSYLISISFGYGSSVQYRGSVTILVNTGNVWSDGKMQKVLNYNVLNGIATVSNNGSNGTDFEGVNVFWNETGLVKTDNVDDIDYISVSIQNSRIDRISNCSCSMIPLDTITCYTYKQY